MRQSIIFFIQKGNIFYPLSIINYIIPKHISRADEMLRLQRTIRINSFLFRYFNTFDVVVANTNIDVVVAVVVVFVVAVIFIVLAKAIPDQRMFLL